MKDKDMQVPDTQNHRQRMHQLYETNGMDGFLDYQVLEYLLFSSDRRHDTKPLAKRLLAYYGSIENVFAASFEDLTQNAGVNNAAARLVAVTGDIHRRLFVTEHRQTKVDTPLKMALHAQSELFCEDNECLAVSLIDSVYKVKATKILQRGNVDNVNIAPATVISLANRCNAPFVMLFHNHPSGRIAPSIGDIRSTMHIDSALSAASLKLLEHVIVSDNDAYLITRNLLYTNGEMTVTSVDELLAKEKKAFDDELSEMLAREKVRKNYMEGERDD